MESLESTVLAAARAGQLPILLDLLPKVSPQTSDWMGRTPLHRAARYNHISIVKLLLQHNALVNITDVHGQSPVHIAAKHGHYEVLYYLIQHTPHSITASACLPDIRNNCTPIEYIQQAETNKAKIKNKAKAKVEVEVEVADHQLTCATLIQLLTAAMKTAATSPFVPPIELFIRRNYCIRLKKKPFKTDDDDKKKKNYNNNNREDTATNPISNTLQYTNVDHQYFQTNGYYIFPPNVLSTNGLLQAQQNITNIYTTLHPNADILRLYNLHQCNETWILNIATHPTILSIVEKHCGLRFYFYLSHIISKPPHSKYAVPWHQDYRTKGNMQHCSIWIALDDMNETNGCVKCKPKQHLQGAMQTQDIGNVDFTSVLVNGKEEDDGEEDEDENSEEDEKDGDDDDDGDGKDGKKNGKDSAVFNLFMNAGQACILDPLMPHSSQENKSNKWRRALVLRYASCESHLQNEKKKETFPNIFKDGSWFADYRSGEVFEGVSLLCQ